jgi:hypothetical protein
MELETRELVLWAGVIVAGIMFLVLILLSAGVI